MLRMGGARWVAAVLLLLAAGGALHVRATSFNPLPFERDLSAVEMVPGDAVFLFHGNTAEVLRSLDPGTAMSVSRIDSEGKTRSVGTIRATAFIGEFCLKGEVVEGKILLFDLVVKDHVFYLVIPEKLCRR